MPQPGIWCLNVTHMGRRSTSSELYLMVFHQLPGILYKYQAMSNTLPTPKIPPSKKTANTAPGYRIAPGCKIA